MFALNEKVMRKTGTDSRCGVIVQLIQPNAFSKHAGDFVVVEWRNSGTRKKATRTTLKATALMPYSENAVRFRERQRLVKYAEKDMKRHYDYFQRATSVEFQLAHAIDLTKAEIRYSKLTNAQITYGKCQSCERVRVLEGCICGTCAHRKARSTNTREMYGHGRRGY